MSQTSTPIHLVCVGRHRELAEKLEVQLRPHFAYPALLDFDNYSAQNLLTLLATLNPRPSGVIVGGGFDRETQIEVKRIVNEHNEAGRYSLKFTSVPLGYVETHGPAALLAWVKKALAEAYGVEW